MATLRVRMPDHSPTAAQAVGHVDAARPARCWRGSGPTCAAARVYARTAVGRAAGLDREHRVAAVGGVPRPPGRPGQGRPARRRGVAGDRGRGGQLAEPVGRGPAGLARRVRGDGAGAVRPERRHPLRRRRPRATRTTPARRRWPRRATGVAPFARAWMRAGHRRRRRREDGEVDRQPGARRGAAARLLARAPIRLLCLNRPWAEPWAYTAPTLDARGGARSKSSTRPPPGPTPRRAGRRPCRPRCCDDLDVPTALAIALEDGGQAARTLIEILALKLEHDLAEPPAATGGQRPGAPRRRRRRADESTEPSAAEADRSAAPAPTAPVRTTPAGGDASAVGRPGPAGLVRAIPTTRCATSSAERQVAARRRRRAARTRRQPPDRRRPGLGRGERDDRAAQLDAATVRRSLTAGGRLSAPGAAGTG